VRAGKRGEPVVADLRHVAVAPLMPGAGIIHADPATDLQCGGEQPVLLGEERAGVTAEQGVDLLRGDVDAPLAQLLVQQRPGDLTVMVLVEYVAAQLGTEVTAAQIARQRPDQPLPVRGLPDFQAIPGVVRGDAQVLNDEVAVTLEARSRRQRHAGGPRRSRGC
jgi:hypothetical protein